MKIFLLLTAFFAVSIASTEAKSLRFIKKDCIQSFKNVKVKKSTNFNFFKKEIASYPSGSGILTDGCGNQYEIEWSCNYDCSGFFGYLRVIGAIGDWAMDNVECPWDCDYE